MMHTTTRYSGATAPSNVEDRASRLTSILILALISTLFTANNILAADPTQFFGPTKVGEVPVPEVAGNPADNDGRVTGQDNASSIYFLQTLSSRPDIGTAYSLWLFADTWLDNTMCSGAGGSDNSGAYTTDLTGHDGIPSDPSASGHLTYKKAWYCLGGSAVQMATRILPHACPNNPYCESSSYKVWPFNGIQPSDGGYVYDYLYVSDGTSRLGTGMARAAAGSPLSWTRLQYNSSYLLWDSTYPSWGLGLVKASDGYLYVYGRVETSPYTMYLARVTPSNIDNPSQYAYYAGLSWSGLPVWDSSFSNAVGLFWYSPSEMSVSYNAYLGYYIMISWGFFDDGPVLRYSSTPWGTWSSTIELMNCPASTTCYAMKEHPEYATNNGKTIYFTMTDSDNGMGANTPDLYELMFR